MSTKQLEPNHILFQESDAADVAYYVVSGKIELRQSTQGSSTQARIVEAGGLVGEQAAFEENSIRSYSAVTLESSAITLVTYHEIQTLIETQPVAMQTLLKTACEKMKPGRNRVIHKQSPALEVTDVKKLTVKPVGQKMEAQFTTHEVSLSKLPYKIGGYPEDGKVNRRGGLHLAIASAMGPLRVSRQHCEIQQEGDKLVVLDLGSRHCTIVNGTMIGRGRGNYSAPLVKGENKVILGTADNEYTLAIICE